MQKQKQASKWYQFFISVPLAYAILVSISYALVLILQYILLILHLVTFSNTFSEFINLLRIVLLVSLWALVHPLQRTYKNKWDVKYLPNRIPIYIPLVTIISLPITIHFTTSMAVMITAIVYGSLFAIGEVVVFFMLFRDLQITILVVCYLGFWLFFLWLFYFIVQWIQSGVINALINVGGILAAYIITCIICFGIAWMIQGSTVQWNRKVV